MRWPSPTLIGVFAVLSLSLAGCSADPAAPPAEPATLQGRILTSFDRLTISRGQGSSFRASLVGSGARLSSAGLSFVSRATSLAAVTATNGRATVQGLAGGRTWVVVQSASAADSVEVIVE
jgi:hypothetical protein